MNIVDALHNEEAKLQQPLKSIQRTVASLKNIVMFGSVRAAIISCALLTVVFGVDAAQDRQAATSPPPTSGAETYREYCAVCHGKTGKGDGSAASALKVRPPDLGTLARRHGGKFPNAYVSNVLRNGVKVAAHGTAEMPIWGPLFLAIDSSFQSQTNLRITNLTNYIKSLQK
jgi:mono/diheme cytochrome c family protein